MSEILINQPCGIEKTKVCEGKYFISSIDAESGTKMGSVMKVEITFSHSEHNQIQYSVTNCLSQKQMRKLYEERNRYFEAEEVRKMLKY